MYKLFQYKNIINEIVYIIFIYLFIYFVFTLCNLSHSRMISSNKWPVVPILETTFLYDKQQHDNRQIQNVSSAQSGHFFSVYSLSG